MLDKAFSRDVTPAGAPGADKEQAMHDYDELFWRSLDRRSFTRGEWETLKAAAMQRARVERSRQANRLTRRLSGRIAKGMRSLVRWWSGHAADGSRRRSATEVG